MTASIPEDFQLFLQRSLEEWAPNSKLVVIKDLVGGKSSAIVLLVDISCSHGSSTSKTTDLSGQYILKIYKKRAWDTEESSEQQRHAYITNRNPPFSDQHTPRIIRYSEDNNIIAILYEIAGLSLINIVTADNITAGSLEHQCRQISLSLLLEMNHDYRIETGISIRKALEASLGYRLYKDKAPSLHQFINNETQGTPTFIIAGRLLVNPLWILEDASIAEDTSNVWFNGLLHGDLHPGNLLIDRQNPRSDRFWLIDFALSHEGLIGYDHSYFELSLLHKHLYGAGPERLFAVLDALEAQSHSEAAKIVPVQDIGVVNCLRSLRSAAVEWQQRNEKHRYDAFVSQQLLTRVAASINWTNKPLKEGDRRIALAYGSVAASKYAETFHPSVYEQLVVNSDSRKQRVSDHARFNHSPPSLPKPLWEEVWKEMSGFDDTTYKYVLVAGSIRNNSASPSLGFLPWSAVLDFDPASDQDGLYADMAPVLERNRSVTWFGRQAITADFHRGTAWIMTGGWPSRNESTPASFREWRQIYLSCIRDLCIAIRRSVSPHLVKVIILPGDGLAGERLDRVIETMDEGLLDLGQFTLFGPDQIADMTLVKRQFALTPLEFIAGIRAVYGTKLDKSDPEIPGAHGPTAIPIDRLRNLEEDLDILHSAILTSSTRNPADQDEFWRGNPPSWADLHANSDIERDIHPQLANTLKELLAESRNYTLELHHTPGSGGTTAALRIAWTLHTAYPTAILRRYSRLTLDRVDQLFQIVQRPILLIAEASILPPSSREELYRGLVSRNSRVVILYVVRTTSTERERAFRIFDPMTPDEAEKFNLLYSRRTQDPKKHRQLKLITTSTDPKWEPYRSPFFYGLITFDRNFNRIDTYVESHLKECGYTVQKIMRYLAMVSRYSQIGLDEVLFRRLMALRSDSVLDIEEIIGPAPSRLVLRSGNELKLMHPLVAEEVLRQLLGGGARDAWRHGLKDLAIDFIRDVTYHLGTEANELQRLFVQLFISRGFWTRLGTRGGHFAELIEAIPTKEGQHQVLELLTQLCPKEAHYWNHLGRHLIYVLKQDYEKAEEHLRKAVALDPEDRIHHHSLGMVRRFWIGEILKENVGVMSQETAMNILSNIDVLASGAFNCFDKTRELEPEDDHGYITHIQLVLEIAERLVQASGGSNVYEVSDQSGDVSRWLRENIIIAEDLLSRVKHMRAEAKPSRYELDCTSDLHDLYGDFESIIRTWESMLGQGDGENNIRRALATAYFARGHRVWSSLPAEELKRVVDLMESNLKEDPANGRDIGMWFQSYRRLPGFSYLQAIDRLQAWASISSSGDAYYYLYILHFLLWRNGVEHNEDQIKLCLEKSRELVKGRRIHSYEWLGVKPSWCPLVHYGDLGEFDRQEGFYPKTDLLAPVTGTIEVIKGRQSGFIRLGDITRAFFVPSAGLWESSDINAIVHFYLGFAYDGFRAWSVSRGPAPQSPKSRSMEDLPAGTREVRTEYPEKPIIARASSAYASNKDVLGVADDVKLKYAVKSFITSSVEKSERKGKKLPLSQLGILLSQTYGKDAIYKRFGYSRLTDFIRSLNQFTLEFENTTQVIVSKAEKD